MTDVIVHPKHLRSVPGLSRRPGYCARGARAWCRANGVDWSTFLRDGLPASVLLATGDPLAARLVDHVRALEHGQ